MNLVTIWNIPVNENARISKYEFQFDKYHEINDCSTIFHYLKLRPNGNGMEASYIKVWKKWFLYCFACFSLVNNLCLITGVMGATGVFLVIHCTLYLLQMVPLSLGMTVSFAFMTLTNVKYARKIKVWHKDMVFKLFS